MNKNNTDDRDLVVNGDAVDIMRKAARGGFEGSIGHVVKNAKKLLGMDPYKGEDLDMMTRLADMVERDYASKEAMDKWLRAFQLEHGDGEMSLSDPATLDGLWTAIADDIPFGYEASKRLADWLRRIARNSQIEQAITETRGDGKLTAEQVRGALLLHLPHREYYSIEQTDAWRAITNELNAALGNGTCEIESESVHDYGGEGSDTYEFALSCGHSVEWLDCEPPRRCPTCGKAVKR